MSKKQVYWKQYQILAITAKRLLVTWQITEGGYYIFCFVLFDFVFVFGLLKFFSEKYSLFQNKLQGYI